MAGGYGGYDGNCGYGDWSGYGGSYCLVAMRAISLCRLWWFSCLVAEDGGYGGFNDTLNILLLFDKSFKRLTYNNHILKLKR